MTRLLIFYLTFLNFISASGQSQTKKLNFKNSTAQKSTLKIDTSKIAIFNLTNNLWLTQKLNATKSFSLTDTDLKKIDEIFEKCISQNNIDTSYFHYKYQYVPFVDKNGQKKVWINCFCADFDNDFPYWKKNIVLVDDGGSCFFNVIINLTDKTLSNFEVNGVG